MLRHNSLLSQRIEMLRFPLIVGILFIHIYTNEIDFNGASGLSGFYSIVVDYISNTLSRISVPLFFVLSGYLFFCNLTPTKEGFIKKLHSRFYTLFVPFVFWNIIIFIFYAFAQTLPVTLHYFNGERPWVMQLDVLQMVELFFGLGDFKYPVAYQFWFIRDLIFIVIFSPLAYILLKRFSYAFLGVLFIVWFFDLLHLSYIQISSTSIFFFCIGAYLGIIRYDFSKSDRYAFLFIIGYIAVSFADVSTHNEFVHNISILLGVVTAFTVTKYLLKRKKVKKRLISLAKYSFFVYALHEPLLSILRKTLFGAFANLGDFSVFLLYFGCVFLTIFITIRIYKILEKLSPQFMSISTGGRI